MKMRNLFVCCMILTTSAANAVPSFKIAWSEYPSWSVYGVAHMMGIIDGREGKLGPIEEKWGVDIVLEEAEYDPCLVMYASGSVDAVCITNMDVLAPSLSRKSVMILPTSTSAGADALIVDKTIATIEDLKKVPTYGLDLSVSRYAFAGGLEHLKQNPEQFEFSNMDPGAAALAMQQKQKGYHAIMVWNPFVLETLNKRPDTRVLFDSTVIPGEIIDSVVVAQASLDKPGGANFAAAVIETYYKVCKAMNNPQTRDETLIALGEKFSNLDLKSMRKVVTQTQFYDTPDKGLALMTGDEMKATMEKVVAFCIKHQIVGEKPSVAFGNSPGSNLQINPAYLQKYLEKAGGK